MVADGNIFADIPPPRASEAIDAILATPNIRIERIVSHGQVSPPGFWYDQDQGEWVILLQGAAALLIDGAAEPVALRPGDYFFIPPHRRHRVHWTDPAGPTVWLAVHFA